MELTEQAQPIPAARAGYYTSVSVRLEGNTVVITRDGKGDVLRVDRAYAHQRMAPVRDLRGRTVAALGLPVNDSCPQIVWGLAWYRGESGSHNTAYLPTEEAAYLALAQEYIV